MSNHFARESPYEDTENLHNQNILPTGKENSSLKKAHQTKYNQEHSEDLVIGAIEIKHQEDKSKDDYQDIMEKVEFFITNKEKNKEDYEKMEKMLLRHIEPNIHPIPCSPIGELLLRNGKFIVAFIQIMTSKEKKDHLQKYLYNYFSELNQIVDEKNIFDRNKEIIFRQKYQNVKLQKKRHNSPSSSDKQINWSNAAERDENSEMKSVIYDLKRENIKECNQNQQKSNNKTKKMKNIASKSKQKKFGKATARRPISKSNHKSIQKVIKSQKDDILHESEGKNLLGSFYRYQISVNRKNQHRELVQVRTSARLSQKKDQRQKNSVDSRKKSLRVNSTNKSRKVSQKKLIKQGKNLTQSQQSSISQFTSNSSKSNGTIGSIFKSEEQTLQIDWIKNHLKQLDIKNVQLYSDYKALTKNDQKITQFLLEMENSQQAEDQIALDNKKTKKTKIESNEIKQQVDSQKKQVASNSENEVNEAYDDFPIVQEQTYSLMRFQPEQKSLPFSEIRKNFQIEELPLTIDHIVDPNLCGHGVYALLKLGRVTELEMGTPYAVTPLTSSIRINRKHIKESLDKAKLLSGEFCDNIGYIPANTFIFRMINKDKQFETKL